MKKTFLLALCTVLLLSGCSSKENESSSTAELTAEVTDTKITEETTIESDKELNTEPTTESPTQETTSNVYAKMSYRELLEDFYYNLKLPQYEKSHNDNDIYDIQGNEFAVYDVDNDGSDELILKITECGTAGMSAFIYDHNDNGEIKLQFSCFPLITFYENSVLKVDSSHNQTYSAFYPFTMYAYDKENDTYNKYGTVYGLDKEVVDFINNERIENGRTDLIEYPQECDKSNSGTVYYIRPDWSSGAAVPCDVTEYNKMFEQFTDGTDSMEIPFMKLTEENINSINR